jgi:hypothetical protein
VFYDDGTGKNKKPETIIEPEPEKGGIFGTLLLFLITIATIAALILIVYKRRKEK